jgi:membrane protein required for colicin V production
MAVLDVLIFVVVAIAAIGGFMRGLVQEILSLASWVLAAFAVHFLHDPVSAALQGFYRADVANPLLAFVLLLLVPYAAMKLIAANISEASSGPVLGPVDRVLGFGFGAIKGALIAVFAFSLLALGFDEDWGFKGRPTWIVTARTYPAADTFSRELVPMIAANREQLRREDEAREAAAAELAK